jgi:hypothetical protein
MKRCFSAVLTIVCTLALTCGMAACGGNGAGVDDGSGDNSGLNAGDPNADPGSSGSTTWTDGLYEIGKDIPAGEYVIIAEPGVKITFQLSTDASKSFDSLIVLESCENRTILSVEDGEFLEFSGGTMYSIEAAPAVSTAGNLFEGTYKIGLDLPAGTYTIGSIDSEHPGFYSISSSSRHSSADIISSEEFNGTVTITVTNGQYLSLRLAELIR